MTEKRFKIIYGVDENPFEWDLLDNEKDALICQSNGRPICDLLNALYEENERLKTLVDFYKDFQKDARELEKAYIQLKHRHSLLHDECLDVEFERDSLKKDVESLEKENEQLKEELADANELNKLLRCTIVEILDFVEENNGVSLEEMKKWWKNKEKELKEEVTKFKEWEKHIGDVKREDLDMDEYFELYVSGKMDFRDFSIIENIWIKLEFRFKEVFE